MKENTTVLLELNSIKNKIDAIVEKANWNVPIDPDTTTTFIEAKAKLISASNKLNKVIKKVKERS